MHTQVDLDAFARDLFNAADAERAIRNAELNTEALACHNERTHADTEFARHKLREIVGFTENVPMDTFAESLRAQQDSLRRVTVADPPYVDTGARKRSPLLDGALDDLTARSRGQFQSGRLYYITRYGEGLRPRGLITTTDMCGTEVAQMICAATPSTLPIWYLTRLSDGALDADGACVRGHRSDGSTFHLDAVALVREMTAACTDDEDEVDVRLVTETDPRSGREKTMLRSQSEVDAFARHAAELWFAFHNQTYVDTFARGDARLRAQTNADRLSELLRATPRPLIAADVDAVIVDTFSGTVTQLMEECADWKAAAQAPLWKTAALAERLFHCDAFLVITNEARVYPLRADGTPDRENGRTLADHVAEMVDA